MAAACAFVVALDIRRLKLNEFGRGFIAGVLEEIEFFTIGDGDEGIGRKQHEISWAGSAGWCRRNVCPPKLPGARGRYRLSTPNRRH
jgi:hypothetical protein